MKTRRRMSIEVPEPVESEESEPFEKWAECGTFNAKTKSYRVARIPAPPQAKAVRERDFVDDSMTVGYRIACACPHCTEDVEFIFAQEQSGHIVRELESLKRQVKSLEFENDLLHSIASTMRDQLDAVEGERQDGERETGEVH